MASDGALNTPPNPMLIGLLRHHMTRTHPFDVVSCPECYATQHVLVALLVDAPATQAAEGACGCADNNGVKYMACRKHAGGERGE